MDLFVRIRMTKILNIRSDPLVCLRSYLYSHAWMSGCRSMLSIQKCERELHACQDASSGTRKHEMKFSKTSERRSGIEFSVYTECGVSITRRLGGGLGFQLDPSDHMRVHFAMQCLG